MPENRYRLVLESFFGQPLALLPSKLVEIRAFLLARSRGEEPPAPAYAGPRERAGVAMVGRTAVLPVYGAIAQRAGMLTEASGGTSCDAIGAALDNLAADKAVKAIVLDCDSPGGSVFGVAELAAKIRSAAADKKVIAVANSLCASAAYWLASQASEVHVTPGGQVGSIGVLAAHEDMSEALKMEGVSTTLVSAGKYKSEGSPYGPLDEDARATMQAMVDQYYTAFVADVARGRGVSEAKVRAGYGQGRCLGAKDARAAGLVDGVSTLEQVLGRLGGAAAGQGMAAAEVWAPPVDLLRRRLDLEEAGS